jgi:hypothetical protein
MKKVALLGDSIRQIGYGSKVAELLGSECEVWQPEDNCRFASYTLRGRFEWKENLEGCAVIHFNCGIWDISELYGDGPLTNIDVYVETMKRIARILLGYSDKVIFATTTPVIQVTPYYKNSVIKQFNDADVPELEKMGVIINDLHTTVWENLDECICADNLHLSQKGIEVCADQVSKIIKENLWF